MKIWIGAPLLACLCMAAGAQQVQTQSAHLSTHPDAVDNAQDRLRLDEVLRLALERSPDAASAEHTIRAMEHHVSQARALPDPMVAAGWAGKLAPFDTMAGDSSSYRGVTVSEQFPYPGKLRLQGEIAVRDVDSARAEDEAVRRRIELEVKTAWAEYYYAGKVIETTRRDKELLVKLEQIAEAQYRVGKASQQDVLRAQVEISLLTEKLTTIEEQRETAMAELNAALQQAPETELPPAADPEWRPLRYSLDELYALAAANDAGIAQSKIMIERGKLSVALAARQSRPDIGLSYMFQQRTNQPDMNGVMVSVNLPVFWKTKQHEAVAEAAETLESAERMRQSRQTAVNDAVRRQYLAAQTAERLLALYEKAVVPQSSLALESAMAEYQSSRIDFQSLIASFSTLLDYETSTYRQRADRETAIAAIESLTGEAITAEPAQPASADQQGAK